MMRAVDQLRGAVDRQLVAVHTARLACGSIGLWLW